MEVTYASVTHVGNREINEDNFFAKQGPYGSCFMVADGLGGHDLGEVASAMVVSGFSDSFDHLQAPKSPDVFLSETFVAAQKRILSEQEKMHAEDKMKSTGVALMIANDQVAFGHVGDSRLYAFSHNKVKLHTMDHSVPMMLVLAGDIKEKEIRHHPDRNRLLRVMGIPWDRPKQEISKVYPARKFQAYLLCSDGFWENIEEKTMGVLLKKSKTVSEWLSAMDEEVQKNGAGTDMDNNTAIAVWVKK